MGHTIAIRRISDFKRNQSRLTPKVSGANLLTCTDFTVQIKEVRPVLAGRVLQHAAEDIQEGRRTVLGDGAHGLLFLPVKRDAPKVTSFWPIPVTSTGEQHLVGKSAPKGPPHARSQGPRKCLLNNPGLLVHSGSQVLTSESDTGGESSMSGTASCLGAALLLSLCSLARGSVT